MGWHAAGLRREHDMGEPDPTFSNRCCVIEDRPHYLRCAIGPGLPQEIQECYRALAAECMRQQGKPILIIGEGGDDSFIHLAARDSIKAIAVAGVPPKFRLAMVAATPDMVAIYESAILEAQRCGFQAKRFSTEKEAAAWLEAP